MQKWICFIMLWPGVTFAGDYDFDWKDKNDMRGAWFLCAPTGFTLGDCPKVLTKCWLPPLIYFQPHKSHFHVRTECVKLPNFFVSVDDIDDALAEAKRRISNGLPINDEINFKGE